MWIDKKTYLGLLDDVKDLKEEVEHLRSQLWEGELIKGVQMVGNRTYVTNSSYPIVKRFKQLVETLGYEYKEIPEEKKFVKKAKNGRVN